MEDNSRNLHFRACSFGASDSYLEMCGPWLPEVWDSELKVAPSFLLSFFTSRSWNF